MTFTDIFPQSSRYISAEKCRADKTDIIQHLSFHCLLLQVCLISATLPHEILEMTSKFMTDPVRILVKRDELTLEVQ